jgi:hypothetical protein
MQEQMSWSELAELDHFTQVDKFNWCGCEEGEYFPYDNCPRVAGNGETVTLNGEGRYIDALGRYGYAAHFGGAWICYTDGHLCDCNAIELGLACWCDAGENCETDH